ncbi:MAG: ABC transporter permease [Caldiserica bacterium]|jgi:tungstate transport system permease protein|nr:ABC transporter permease [Caldisericota bacterium]MDH7563104.1 ABC transporter permease [Caldisericota bacterium]
MDTIWEGLKEAINLIITFNSDLREILLLSLGVSGMAISIAVVLGIPTGVFLGLRRFPGRNFFITLVNTGMGLPPVVVGLVVFLLLARSGPLGNLNLLYTPSAMIIAQVIIALPVVMGVTMAGVQNIDEKLRLQILALGASRWQYFCKILKEGRLVVLSSLAAGFGSIISEVGAVIMVGGNIKGQTRVLTTAIVLETRQGNFSLAIALGIILLLIALILNFLFTFLQQRRPR